MEAFHDLILYRLQNLRMIVAEECVFDRHEAAHAINLFDMHQKYADVLPLADILEYIADWHASQDR